MSISIVLSSWQCHCESSLGSCDECRLSAKRLSTLRPSQQTWAVNPPVCCHHLYPLAPFIIITQPEGWYSFYRPTEGRRLSWPRWLVYLLMFPLSVLCVHACCSIVTWWGEPGEIESYLEFTQFMWWMQTKLQAAAYPQTKPTDLGCESACRLPSATPTVTSYYYYSARRLILILPAHRG